MINFIEKWSTFEIECDCCKKEAEYVALDFHDGLDQAKEDGWVQKHHVDEWFHFCSVECRNKFEQDIAQEMFKNKGGK